MKTRVRRFLVLLRSAWVEYERDHARYFAVAMVYYALVSLVPMLLLVLAALGLLLRFSTFAASAEQQLLLVIEDSFGTQLGTTIEQLLDRLQQESVVATFISLAGLLLTASVLFKHLRLSFRAIWRYQPPLVSGSARVVARTTFLEQVKAFAMMAVAGMLLLVALGLFAAVQRLSGLFGEAPLGDATGWLLALAGALVIVTFTFALLFKFLPPVPLAWRHVWLAAVLCAAAWIITAEMLALYGAYFAGSASAAGAVGGLLAIMVWMNTVSQALFYGAELCKVVASRDGYVPLDSRSIERPEGASPAPPVDRRVSQPRRRAG
jgi:membrane protein